MGPQGATLGVFSYFNCAVPELCFQLGFRSVAGEGKILYTVEKDREVSRDLNTKYCNMRVTEGRISQL
jgi:hypothetical protein